MLPSSAAATFLLSNRSLALKKLPSEANLRVERAFYRPCREEFLTLDSEIQEHVLNGGLIHSPFFPIPISLQEEVDPNIDWEDFQLLCLKWYNTRLKNNIYAHGRIPGNDGDHMTIKIEETK